jgi:DNA-binding MarR family transcriptional regulator
MSQLENEPGLPFYVVSRLISQAFRAPLDVLGLTYPQYLVMCCLWEKDGLMVSHIGERLSLDSGTLTPLLKRLEAMNLVKRERSEEDERRVEIQLTYPGKSLQSKAGKVSKKVDGILDSWKEKDSEKLFELVNKLIFDLQQKT